MSNFSNAVNQLNTNREIDEAYRLLKARTTEIDRDAAGLFKLNQPVTFLSSKHGVLSGRIDSIGRTGRVKVKLNGGRFDSYSMGASFLKENLR